MERQFVLDNSIVMSWCFQDESGAYSDHVLGCLENAEALVPAVWPLEVSNVLLVAERKNRLSKADSIRFLNLISALPIFVHQETPERMLKDIFALARTCKLSSYDASYLDLAMKNGLAIATQDAGLKKAANLVKVPLFKGNAD